eukprot:COSAG01_NODE_2214_length_8156_cov_27.117910_2_plen_56_part_00
MQRARASAAARGEGSQMGAYEVGQVLEGVVRDIEIMVEGEGVPLFFLLGHRALRS